MHQNGKEIVQVGFARVLEVKPLSVEITRPKNLQKIGDETPQSVSEKPQAADP